MAAETSRGGDSQGTDAAKDQPRSGSFSGLSRPKEPPFLLPQPKVKTICILLFLAVAGIFLPSLNNGFINFDDNIYVTANTHVQQGLSWDSLKWAFRSTEHGIYWHPLTWLSHMLDYRLFGLEPWGHHLTALLLHASNTVLLFLVLHCLTGAIGRSFFVAALFGLHPLHVETAVWVAERKGVLSTFFWLLTMLAYWKYVNESKVQSSSSAKAMEDRPKSKVKIYYGLTLLCFAMGLMAKPMLVTLPFVLLLMDYWPLGRIYEPKDLKSDSQIKAASAPLAVPMNRKSYIVYRKLIWEKVPFFLLAGIISAVAYLAQKSGGPMTTDIPLATRIENAPVACCRYIAKMIYPLHLCVVYPQPDHWPKALVLLSCVLLLGSSIAAFMARRRFPYLFVGWLWFLGTLAPVIGLIQVGWAAQSMADRYTYVSLIGLFIILAWGASDLTANWRHQYRVMSGAAALALVICATLTSRQIGYWRDSETLFRHAIALTKDNYVAYHSLGEALAGKGQFDEAITLCQKVLQLRPNDGPAHNNLGSALEGKGREDEAIGEYQKAIQARPDYADAYFNIGVVRQHQGRLDEAINQYQKAVQLLPTYVNAHNNLAVALYQNGRVDEAISQFQQVVKLKPDYAGAHFNLGNVLLKQSRLDEAAAQFQETARLDPNNAYAQQNLGDICAQQGKVEEADKHHQEALRLIVNSPH